jgi:Na+/H+ antiporter NhaC
MHRNILIIFLIFFVWIRCYSQEERPVSSFDLQVVRGENSSGLRIVADVLDGVSRFEINGAKTAFEFVNGVAVFPGEVDRKGTLTSLRSNTGQLKLFHVSRKKSGNIRLRALPLWLSILPPLVAIGLALLFKEVIISLFAGVWVGAFIAGGMRLESIFYMIESFLLVVQKYVIEALSDVGHMSVIIFSILIGGMVAIISRNGGMAGVVKSLSKYARSPISAQFITWMLGVAIFFDDYANTLIVGNTMRSVTDRFKVSREKLAYIVDSTAAPVAAVAFITTWIGAELGYIDDGIGQIADFPFDFTAYAIFLGSLKYSFYPVLTLSFILMLIFLKKDFGPMYLAEKRARTTGQISSALKPEDDEPNMEDLSPVKGAPLKWQHAFFPVVLVILVTICGLVVTGMQSIHGQIMEQTGGYVSESYRSIWRQMSILFPAGESSFFVKIGKLIGSSDSYTSLLWSSTSGVVLAIAITQWNKIMKLVETMHSMVTGFKTMLPALIILTLAWSLAITTKELHTATFLSSALAGTINPYFMPALIFVLSAVIAFSTGSSWSTMAILYPIAIPTTWAICMADGIDPTISMEILLNVISIVLGASVLGDHCSPISDTTILSSLASDCNHIDHVRTQLPYALVVGSVSLIAGTASTLLGGGWLIAFIFLVLALLLLFGIVFKVGKRVPKG